MKKLLLTSTVLATMALGAAPLQAAETQYQPPLSSMQSAFTSELSPRLQVIAGAADLEVVSFINTSTPRKVGRDTYRARFTIKVRNSGGIWTWPVKIAAMQNYNGQFVPAKIDNTANGKDYVHIGTINAGEEFNFTAEIIFHNTGGLATQIYIDVDSCVNESGMPATCREPESNEHNNRSRILQVAAPDDKD